jgi:protein PhnA
MTIDMALSDRAGHQCELCGNTENLITHTVTPRPEAVENQVLICGLCHQAITGEAGPTYWRFLTESIWNPEPAVQALSYRLLQNVSGESWAADTLAGVYLDDAVLEWAQAVPAGAVVHLDSNGHVLQAGDSVVLIQDLQVKGASFTAKRGTAVRKIRLVPDNAEQIEGKVNDQLIVILTKYVKKP